MRKQKSLWKIKLACFTRQLASLECKNNLISKNQSKLNLCKVSECLISKFNCIIIEKQISFISYSFIFGNRIIAF